MTRSTGAPVGLRGPGTATMAVGLILVMVGGLACIALRSAPSAERPAAGAMPVDVKAPAAGKRVAPETSAQMPLQTPHAPRASRVAAPMPPNGDVPSKPPDMPYRFVGKAGSGAEAAVVLFGRGRVVTVHGPGPLDDEYGVEAVFDDYLVIRHVRTGAGRFLPLIQRQKVVEPPQDPESSPHD